ncbi:MAG TPA: Ig domain-containing protein [Alloacidobacterium sp.]|nr:Ig domain-containing protein [Alloacidobacterium sp.]
MTWQVSGQGTIDGSGEYNAPSSVIAQNQSRGCQELPNNSPFNIPVDSLPVDSHSSRWLTRVAQDGQQYFNYHNLKFYPNLLGFYDNVVNNNTNQQLMTFFYGSDSNGYQNTDFPIPPERTLTMETGRSIDAYVSADRHMFSINSQTCAEAEIYNLYYDFQTVTFTPGNPTTVNWTTNTIWPMPQSYGVFISGAGGAWSAANGNWRLTPTGPNTGTLPFDSSDWGPAPSGTILSSTPNDCNNCNSAAGQQFSPTSYAQLGGVDAAGMPMSAASLKPEEWYAATQAGRSDLGHAIRTTLSNRYISARNTWPATSFALAVAGAQIQLTGGTDSSPITFTTGSDLSGGQPCNNYTYTSGCQFYVHIFGFTGPWAAANGDQTATAIDNYHFTVQLNSSAWGPMPSTGVLVFDFLPYGATIRLKASFDPNTICTSTDLSTYCPYLHVYLNTLKKYGMILADGTIPSDNWDNGTVSSEFHPNVLRDAASAIFNATQLQPFEQYVEVVNRSSQQLSSSFSDYQQTNTNRTYVTVCGSAGCASDDVILQGTTVGTDRERLTVAAGVLYQLSVWVNGNISRALSYSVDSGIPGLTVSSSGVLTMPNCTVKERGMVTVTSLADPSALPLYIEVACLPVSTDGSYRLALGNYSGDYTDSNGFKWYGSWANYGFNNIYEAPGILWGSQLGSWQGNVGCQNDTWTGADSQLYSRSTSFSEDTRVEVILPNGNYNLNLYGEPGFGGFSNNGTCGNTVGQNIFDWVIQGNIAGSWLDGYVLAGMQPYNGYILNGAATVSDNVLSTIGRERVISTYGMSWSSLLISPTSLPLTITTNTLPSASSNLPYIAPLAAAHGVPPYTWSLASGSGPLPPGLILNPANGLISGRPTSMGRYPFTAQVTDSQMNTATKNLSITVCSSGHLCAPIP